MKNKANLQLMVFISFLFLVSCKTTPSETDAINFINSDYKIKYDYGVDKAFSVTKTNGIKNEVNGQAIYQFEYEAKVKLNAIIGGNESVLKGTLYFEKTENGWRVFESEIKSLGAIEFNQ